MAEIHIRTPRLLIRAFRREDAPALQPIVGDPAVVEFLPEPVMDADATGQALERVLAWYQTGDGGRITKFSTAVLVADREELIGWVGLGALEFQPDEIELYYGFRSSHWGQGYATEAAAAMLQFGFDVIGLARVIGIVHPRNGASRRVLEKLGMRFRRTLEGLPPEHSFFEGLDSLELSPQRFADQCPASIHVRRLPHDQLGRLAEIDRSEHVTRAYRFSGDALIERAVDWQVPNWSRGAHTAHSVAALVRQFAPLLARGGELLGAFDGPQLIGLGVLRYRLAAETAQLALLHVSRSRRRRGVATLLTAEMMRLARWRGARRMYVSATPSGSAVGFYRSQGFRPTADVHPELFALEPEDIHMIRSL